MARTPHLPRPSDLLAGTVAGALGTLAMDRLQYQFQQKEQSEDGSASNGGPGFAQWEISADDIDSFDEAGAPAEVGRRLAAAAGRELPDHHAGLTQDVVHWATGLGWGMAAAVVASRRPGAPIRSGIVTGMMAVITAYTVLGWLGIYKPVWEYDRRALARDVAGHLVYGTATGLALRRLPGRR